MKRHLTVLALITSLFGTSACVSMSKHNEQVGTLQEELADMQTQVGTLDADKHDMCMLTVEFATGARIVYLGDDYFLDRISGTVKHIPEMIDQCNGLLEQLREALEKPPRSTTLEEFKANQPPVTQ